ncbi:hypothetical protein FGO68_gene3288 [Halteria grandinella]|uniref:Alpha/beta hydrolase fold-3 domain-containing protein n=1 Tax=Halteria grandinella TaxID=5974 RepID=A0A8J8P1Q6_HALGN|nr:hypothetical protein FGO68_gene3288 [Halteria grandinella]
MCIESYIGKHKGDERCNPQTNYYISPSLAPDHVLAKFPTTRIMVPTNDPLRDESFKFTLRLAKQGIDVFLREYMYMPHGYLNFNAPMLGMKDEANETISQCIKWMSEIINGSSPRASAAKVREEYAQKRDGAGAQQTSTPTQEKPSLLVPQQPSE